MLLKEYIEGYRIDLSVFSPEQLKEILEGMEQNLDILWYASPKYNESQMEQIRLGMEDDLDISMYANPGLNYLQMEQIRIGMMQGIDVSYYAEKKFTSEQMEQIRCYLSRNEEECKKIGERNPNSLKSFLQEHGINIYDFSVPQIEQLRLGMKYGVDILLYANPIYNWQQMQQMLWGLEDGLNITSYASPEISWEEMQYQRLKLMNILRNVSEPVTLEEYEQVLEEYIPEPSITS